MNFSPILPPLAAMMPAGISGLSRVWSGTRNKICGVEALRLNGQTGFDDDKVATCV